MTPNMEQDRNNFVEFRSSHIIKIWKIFISYMALINLIQLYKFMNDPNDG